MTRKKLNITDPGDSTHFGSNDIDYINYLLTGTDQSVADPVVTNTSWTATKVTMDNELNTFTNAQDLSRYTVYRTAGGTYKYKDWRAGTTTSNTNSIDDMLNNSLFPAVTVGAYINILAGDGLSSTFIIKNPILLPLAAGAGIPIKMMGSFPASKRSGSVTLQADPSFPTGRFMIEGICTPGGANASKAPSLQISDIFFYNPNFAPNGTVDSTHPNIGGISLEFDQGLNWDGCRIENCMFQYLYQGISLAGFLYYGRLNRLNFDDAGNSTFVGDYDIKIYGGTAGHTEHPPKIMHASYIASHHIASQMNNSLWAECAYSLFTDYFIDGYIFKESAFGLHGEGTDGCHDNEFIRFMTFDLAGVPTPDNRKGTVYLNGANCYGNKLLFTHVNQAPYMVMFDNGAYRNSVHTMYWGGNVNIKDDAAGTRNIVYIEEGSQTPTSSANVKITSTASNVRIVDERTGAVTRGLSATQSGNGSTTVFNIAHGCFSTPTYVMVHPATAAAAGSFSLSATSTNIVITYAAAPASGTNNLQWYYYGDVYSS